MRSKELEVGATKSPGSFNQNETLSARMHVHVRVCIGNYPGT